MKKIQALSPLGGGVPRRPDAPAQVSRTAKVLTIPRLYHRLEESTKVSKKQTQLASKRSQQKCWKYVKEPKQNQRVTPNGQTLRDRNSPPGGHGGWQDAEKC